MGWQVFAHLSAKFGKLKCMTEVIPFNRSDATAVRLRSAMQAYLAGEAVLQGRPERIMKLAAALLAARTEHSDNTCFSVWLAKEGLDNLGADDRAALLNMAKYPDLSWQVLQKTERISIRLIWEQDIKPLIPRQAAIATTIQGETVSAAMEALRVQPSSQRCEDGHEVATSEKTMENQSDTSVLTDQTEAAAASVEADQPAPHPVAPTRVSPQEVAKVTTKAGYYGLPRLDEVLAMFPKEKARVLLSLALKQSAAGKREIWSLLLKAIDAGLLRPTDYTPATNTGRLPLRLLLPDLPESLSRDYDLTISAVRKEVRDVILPAIIDQKDAFLKDPATLRRLVNAWKIKRSAEIAARAQPKPHSPPVITPPDSRPVIVMYGTQLWPIVDNRYGDYDYDQLRSAIWSFQQLDRWFDMTNDNSPKSRAIMIRFSTKYYSAYAERALDKDNGGRMRQVFQLVHTLATLLETNPDSQCTPPVTPHGNLGWD